MFTLEDLESLAGDFVKLTMFQLNDRLSEQSPVTLDI